jgi:hypothetical protein
MVTQQDHLEMALAAVRMLAHHYRELDVLGDRLLVQEVFYKAARRVSLERACTPTNRQPEGK